MHLDNTVYSKIIAGEDISCWSKLSWQAEPAAILLRIHKDVVSNIQMIPEHIPIVQDLMKEFGFKNFSGGFEKSLGFEDSFLMTENKGDFVEFVGKIPEIKKIGKAVFKQAAYALSASFTVLSPILPSRTSAPFCQLIAVNTMTRMDMEGGSLDGAFSIPLVKWLGSLPNHEVSEIVQAMQIAYNCMSDSKLDLRFEFRAWVCEGGWFTVSCPGNACGFGPEDGAEYKIEQGFGYEFESHNVDTPMQQITLLAGLAALGDKARREM